MKNMSSYRGLVDAKIRASDKDLPVLSVKSMLKISLIFVAFSENMNFKRNVSGLDPKLSHVRSTGKWAKLLTAVVQST